MARGLYKNLVTHLVMMEGEGLIETEDVAVAVVKAQEAAVKKGAKLYQHIADKALVERGKATLENPSLMNVSEKLLTTPVKMQKEVREEEAGKRREKEGIQEEEVVRKGKVGVKQSLGEGVKPSGRRNETEVKQGKKEKEEVVLLQMETDADPELSGRGDEKKEKKRKRRRSGILKEEWLVRINNRMEENEKKKEEELMEMGEPEKDTKERSEKEAAEISGGKKKAKRVSWQDEQDFFLSNSSSSSTDSMPVLNKMEENKKEEELMETYKKVEDSSFLSLSSSSSTDSMPVLSDQSKEGPCLLLSSPPVLDVRNILIGNIAKIIENVCFCIFQR